MTITFSGFLASGSQFAKGSQVRQHPREHHYSTDIFSHGGTAEKRHFEQDKPWAPRFHLWEQRKLSAPQELAPWVQAKNLLLSDVLELLLTVLTRSPQTHCDSSSVWRLNIICFPQLAPEASQTNNMAFISSFSIAQAYLVPRKTSGEMVTHSSHQGFYCSHRLKKKMDSADVTEDISALDPRGSRVGLPTGQDPRHRTT